MTDRIYQVVPSRRRRRLCLHCGAVAGACALALPGAAFGHAPPTPIAPVHSQAAEATPLSGHALVRKIEPGATDRFAIDLNAGDYLQVVVEQRGPEVSARLLSPAGHPLAQATRRIPDDIVLAGLAKTSGTYVVEIHSLESAPVRGDYVVAHIRRHRVMPRDQDTVLAEQLGLAADSHVADGRLELARVALEEYRMADLHWRAAGSNAGQARASRKLGEISYLLGRQSAAKLYLLAAVPLAHDSGDSKEECSARVTLAAVYLDEGRTEEAATTASPALEFARTNHDDRCESRALNVVGDVDAFSGRTAESLDRYEQALELSRALGDRREQAQALLNIAYTDFDLAKTADAEASYAAALTLFRAVADTRGEARTLTGLGNLHVMGGDNQTALDEYRVAKALVEQSGDHVALGRILNGLGAAHARTGDVEGAVRYYGEAAAVFRSLRNQNGEASSLLPLGVNLMALGRYDDALIPLSKALTLSRAVSDSRLEARALEHLGRARLERREWDLALAQYQKSLSLGRAVDDSTGIAEALNGIANVQFERGDYARALQLFDDALELTTHARDRPAESLALYNLARTEAALGHTEEALTRVRASLDLGESLRTDVASLDLRASYLASVRDRYELEIDLLMQLHGRNPMGGYDALAFDASERARARAFLDGLSQARAGIREGADVKLLEQERLVTRALDTAAQQLRSLPPQGAGTERASATRTIEALTLKYQDLESQIREGSPRYAALVQPRPLRLHDVQQLLGDDTSVLLQYFAGRVHSYLWAITEDAVIAAILPPSSDIERQTRPYLTALSAESSAVNANRSHSNIAESVSGKALSDMLLAPVAPSLSDRRVLIVADGILDLLPFVALPEPEPIEGSYERVALVVHHEIVHLPSASTIALLRGAWSSDRQWPKPLVVLADPVFEADDPRLSSVDARAGVRASSAARSQPLARAMRDVGPNGMAGIPRLLASRQEARAIAALVPDADLALDFRASRATVTGLASGEHRIVHFATHGLADSAHPELSGIVLSLFDKKGREEDGFLRLHDIYNLTLGADLVVLSACSTGLGKQVAGEGLIGLVRGFMYAGSRRVLASLWKVDDEATSELMARFYRGMFERGLSAPAALRAAQLQLRATTRWRHPFYWAAFVLQGDWTEASSLKASTR